MYIKIRLLMLVNKITFDDIAKILNISSNTARNKIYGKSKLSVEDLKAIKTSLFTNYTYEELSEIK